MPKWMMWGALVICLGMMGCGRRTPPHPIPSSSSLEELTVMQRGPTLRLSWKMPKLPKAEEKHQILLRELAPVLDCAACPPKIIEETSFLFPQSAWIIQGKQIFWTLATSTQAMRIFEVEHRQPEGKLLGKQRTIFQGAVRFPPPTHIEGAWLPLESFTALNHLPGHSALPKLPTLRPLRLSWERQVERLAFDLSPQGENTPTQVYYRVNLYRTTPGQPWPEKPLNLLPLHESFYIDYPSQTEHSYLYHLRLVDQQGQESEASSVYTVSLSF